jgi:predicted dehydrogenase
MKIGIIGFRNHASRLASEILSLNYAEQIIFYHPNAEAVFDQTPFKFKEKYIFKTNKFTDLEDCVAVVIASPSNTHVEYIKKLLNFDVFIFCEKPLATNLEEINFVKSLPESQSSRIYVNFHMLFNEFAINLKKFVKSGAIGKALHLSMISTHGLSYKEAYGGNWRFQDKNPFSNIFGNLGIHYLHFYESLFGQTTNFDLCLSNINTKFHEPDSVNISLSNSDGISANFFLSYSAPFNKHGECYFNNGIIFEKNGLVEIQEPRDFFDASGKFIAANRKIIEPYTKDNIVATPMQKAINHFFRGILSKKGFSKKDFELAIRASELVLSMSNKP